MFFISLMRFPLNHFVIGKCVNLLHAFRVSNHFSLPFRVIIKNKVIEGECMRKERNLVLQFIASMTPNKLLPNEISVLKYFPFILLLISATFAAKTIYVPSFLARDGVDLNDCNTQFCYDRSAETDNYIIFWEKGFGSDPSTASGTYRVNMTALKAVAEKSFTTYVDTLKMVIKGSSLTDKYKQMIFLLYQTEWAAYGSGQDDMVGTLHVDSRAANIDNVVAHEIGHCFEYMTGVDVPGGGYRYGFGVNGSGGNGFWEQIAQWESVKVYPEQQFPLVDFSEYIRSNHMHFLHETPRYANYFIGDFWAYKHGIDFMGKLWREARSPEDPVDTYKRLNNITQEQFNDEMYEHAARLTTWDLPAIKSYGTNYINNRSQVKMNLTSDNYWLVDPSVAIENYGYNSIKLNAPSTQTAVSVSFKGKAGASGFRSLNIDKGGWRYGFVALLKDGTRVYSDMATAKYANGANPEGSLNFSIPANCDKLWLVVSGSPQEYWHHAWDDDNTNDEQWPYEVQFTNTNLLGEKNNIEPTYSFTISVVGAGTVNPTSGNVISGVTQTLTATPATGYFFSGWSGDASGTDNPLSITIDGNKTIVATFTANPVKILTNNNSDLKLGSNLYITEDLISYFAHEKSLIDVYDMKGSLVASFIAKGQGMKHLSELHISRNGVYKIILITDNKIKAVKTITYVDAVK